MLLSTNNIIGGADMRKTKLCVTHSNVTKKALKEFVSGHGPVRIGLRVAILQGIMDNVPIYHLSRRHNISRQAIYNIVNRVNENGIKGLYEKKRSGRHSRLIPQIKEDLKDILTKPPMNQGYKQSRWDGPLVRRYLEDKHGIRIGRSQVLNWLQQINFSLQRGREKFSRANPKEQEIFVKELKKTSKSGKR